MGKLEGAAMNANDRMIQHIAAFFGRIYLGGIPCLLNDDGAFLSFICCLTAIEALAGFLKPKAGNGVRFKAFVKDYFPEPYPSQADALWKLRNAAVHGFSPGPYKLTHHNSHVHLSIEGDRTILNAEDFYAALVFASHAYFAALAKDAALQKAFEERVKDPAAGGVLLVVPATGKSRSGAH
jgi:hypothetical protein